MSINSTFSDVNISEMTNTFFEITDDLVFFLDKELNIILVNSSVLKKTGYNFDELKGKKIHDLLSSDFKVVKEKLCSSIDKNEYLKLEIIFRNKDKSTFCVESENTLVSDENGEIKYVISINRDIIEREKAERRVKEFDQRIRNIIESVPIGIALSDQEGNIYDANSTMWRMFGAKSNEEFLQAHAQDFYYNQIDRETFLSLLETEGKVHDFVCQFQSKGSDVFWGSISSVIESEDIGEKRFLTTIKNITERKETEEELRRSELKLGERVKELIGLYTISSLLIDTEKSYEDMFNSILTVIPLTLQYPESTIARIIKKGNEFTSPDFEITPWKLSEEIVINEEKLGELEFYYKDEKPEEDEGPFLREERDLIKAIAREISRYILRKETEKELTLKNQAIETSINGIVIADLNGFITYANPAFIKLVGYNNLEEVLGKSANEIVLSGAGAEIFKEIKKQGHYVGEVASRRRDGTSNNLQLAANIVKDAVRKPCAIMTSIIDITERKRVEEALNLAFAELNQIFNTSADGMRVVDMEFNTLRVNEAFVNLSGVSKEESVGKKCHTIFGGSACNTSGCRLNRIVEGEERVEVEATKEKKNGALIHCIITATPFLDPKGKLIGIVENFKDITERKNSERMIEYLYDQIKFVNQIMRHDIRNNLAIIYGSIDLYLETGLEGDKPDLLLRALRGTQKSEALIERMHEFENLIVTGKEKLEIMDIREIVENIIATQQWQDISFKIEGKGKGVADLAIESVLDNIIGNAAKHSEADEIRIKIKEKEETCVIEVTDNGIGVPDELKNIIFEHRLKHGPTAGTGLGLYIAKKAIEKYEGTIKVEDNEPKGSKFIIELKKTKHK